MEPLDHDAAYKQIYGHAFMVEELARWRMPALAGGRELLGALDFATLSRLPEQSAAGGRRRSGDMVWRVRLRDGRGPGGWRHLVLMLEFQSEVDFLMALRCRSYVDGFHLESSRGVRFGAGGRLPPVLVFVVYNGGRPWTDGGAADGRPSRPRRGGGADAAPGARGRAVRGRRILGR